MQARISALATQHGVTPYAVVLDALDRGGYTLAGAARALQMSESTLLGYAHKHKLELPGNRRVVARLAMVERCDPLEWTAQAVWEAGSLRRAALAIGVEPSEVSAVFQQYGVSGNPRLYVHMEGRSTLLTAAEAARYAGLNFCLLRKQAMRKGVHTTVHVASALQKAGTHCTVDTLFLRPQEEAKQLRPRALRKGEVLYVRGT